MCGPPLTQVRGWRGDQLMLQAGGGGGLESGWVLVGSWRAPKIMGARPHPESTQNNGGVPSSCGRFGDFLLFFMQLRVDDFQIRSR